MSAAEKDGAGALEQLSALEREATPAPWAYTTGCGAVVLAGEVAEDEAGFTALKKGSYSLFEIEPDAYWSDDEPEFDEDGQSSESRREAQAQTDAKLIAMMRNQLRPLLDERDVLLAEVAALRTDFGRTVYLGNLARARTPEEWDELSSLLAKGYRIATTQPGPK